MLCFTYDFLATEVLTLQGLLFMLFSPLRGYLFSRFTIFFLSVLLSIGFLLHFTITLCTVVIMSFTIILVLSLFVCLLQVFMNVLTLGCYLLHGPGGACYVTYMRGVFLFLTVVRVLSLFVCLFFTEVCECSHPRGVLFVT